MESPQSPRRRRAPPRARKSIAHMPSPNVNIEKENLTVDAIAEASSTMEAKAAAKKPRSKSIGPGGLDVLREDTGNRRQSAAVPIIKSILKPTIFLSPSKPIPLHAGSRKTSPNKAKSKTTPQKSPSNSLLDTSVWKSSNPTNGNGVSSNSSERPDESNAAHSGVSPSQRRTRVAVRTEEEQQAAAKERERQEALDHNNSRRKSLANRRVSFAPEATLHTWDVVELPEDSTTSTNSTRRASSLSTTAASPYVQPRSPLPGSDLSEPPSTPPKQAEEVQVAASPVHQRDLHRKRRRRSSVIPPMNFNSLDDFSSSPLSGESMDDGTENQGTVMVDEDEQSSNSDDLDSTEGESVVTEVDADNITTRSNHDSSTGSSGKLEEALRQAAQQAGTQGIDFDENADISMEMADDEVTAAFKPWIKKGKYIPQTIENVNALQDENTNPFSPAFKASTSELTQSEEVEKTMELTQAIGSILPRPIKAQISPKVSRRRSSIVGKRRSSGANLRSSEDGSILDDETMDLTTAIGSIQANTQVNEATQINVDSVSTDEAENLTMEFTSVVGGLIGRTKEGKGMKEALTENHQGDQRLLEGDAYENEEFSYNEAEMDMTIAAGGILPPITEQTEPLEDQTVDMDITTAIGAILPREQGANNKPQTRLSMRRESDAEQCGFATSSALPNHVAAVASETGSPSLATSQRRIHTKKALFPRQSTTPNPESRHSTPLKKPATPSKQLTPKLMHPTTPDKTPPSRGVVARVGSPKKLFNAEIKQRESAPLSLTQNLLFSLNESSGEVVPSIILKPRTRRSSGLGIDRDGLGSPRVTALLDRRRSIGDDAKVFTPQNQISRAVTFEDPKAMEEELDNQRLEDERRESGRGILQMEADSQELEDAKDATSNLKDMIESLTPKKKKLNGRKSLHVGAAKGLLGKRPAELDEDDEDEDEDLIHKRLKGREGSPVKKIRLPAHPPKTVTTGRITRSARRSLTDLTENYNVRTPKKSVSPEKKARITTPNDQLRFRDAELLLSAAKEPTSFEDKLNAEIVQAVSLPEKEDPIHLQDFLNMTSIRFMELTTTKRRLTVASNGIPKSSDKLNIGKTAIDEKDSELERCVVAGACIVPMLDLYQHSCRELKKYITEGRSIVREIETDTYEQNPPLFREYMLAPPDIKPIMDNQFKNVKTHARLLSKAMWYEWRMKLLDGLKEGLLKISDDMDEDNKMIRKQEDIMEPVLPELIQQHELLEDERQNLQSRADELSSYDQEELQDARNSLTSVEDQLLNKRRVLEDLEGELRRHEDGIEHAVEHKQQYMEEIREAEKICQDCRGWSNLEVAALQASVETLEKTHGWTITAAAGSSLTMSYNHALQLFFRPASFVQSFGNHPQPTDPGNSPISLTYIADTHEYHPQSLSTEKRFFLQIMRAQLQCLPQNQTKIKHLLNFVSFNWEQACSIAEEARMLGISYITESMILSDETMKIRSILLLRDMRTKVELGFKIGVKTDEKSLALDIVVSPSAGTMYGEELKQKNMSEFLQQRISGKAQHRQSDAGVWARAVEELEQKLIARGKK